MNIFKHFYTRDKEYLFDATSPEFFTSATRSRIVEFLLKRKRFSDDPNDDFAFGMKNWYN